ncbi:hypothetical protein RN001_014331 [Aquatica leii]|uniref:Uncharacterized protein n=1 Tax=Aquatica leii TaxID=1421715 RepID=A0AAN7P5N5_9COLE|nr:hypothetical protein RN001_014331 [Aquatica leii]
MKYSGKYLQNILLFSGLVVITGAKIRDKRQVNAEVAAGEEDRIPSETGFAEAVHAGSKYYQYAHVPAKDHYEFGEKRGNEHHFIERHEKAHPHAGEFKTKVRWGDKHGGYGEHYWDYNHAGHDHDGDGEESKKEEEYAAYEQSEQVPVVVKTRQRRDLLDGDVEYINERARSLVENGGGSKHGGNYKREPSSVVAKKKRQNLYSPTFSINSDAELQPRVQQNPIKFFNY